MTKNFEQHIFIDLADKIEQLFSELLLPNRIFVHNHISSPCYKKSSHTHNA